MKKVVLGACLMVVLAGCGLEPVGFEMAPNVEAQSFGRFTMVAEPFAGTVRAVVTGTTLLGKKQKFYSADVVVGGEEVISGGTIRLGQFGGLYVTSSKGAFRFAEYGLRDREVTFHLAPRTSMGVKSYLNANSIMDLEREHRLTIELPANAQITRPEPPLLQGF